MKTLSSPRRMKRGALLVGLWEMHPLSASPPFFGSNTGSSTYALSMQTQQQKAPLGFLGWLVAVTVWVTWAPFDARVGGASEFQLNPSLKMETASYLFLLVPVALVLAVLGHGKESSKHFVHAWGCAALLGLLPELGQWWVEGRGPSHYDALANCIGAALAVWGAMHLMRRGLGTRPMLVGGGAHV